MAERVGAEALIAAEATNSGHPRIARRSRSRLALAAGALGLLLTGCGKGSDPVRATPTDFVLVATYTLALAEPSDLAIDPTGTTLWTVTNNPSGPDSVYRLDPTGKVTKRLKYSGHDLEGVAYDPSDQTLWVAEENRREVVHLDLDGNVLSTTALGLTGEVNSGLEGICLDGGGHMFVLNEKKPGLFIPLDPALSIAATDTLTFAGDYSGMTYEPRAGSFWIVSDQSQRLYLWSKAAGVLKSYTVPFPNIEGVAIDLATNRVYIVSDSESKLYVFQYTP